MRSKIAFHVLVRSVRNRQSFGPSVTISPALKGPPGSISTRGPSENLLVTMSRKVSAAITPIDISMSCMMFFIEFFVCRELELQAINGLNEARNRAFFRQKCWSAKAKKDFWLWLFAPHSILEICSHDFGQRSAGRDLFSTFSHINFLWCSIVGQECLSVKWQCRVVLLIITGNELASWDQKVAKYNSWGNQGHKCEFYG